MSPFCPLLPPFSHEGISILLKGEHYYVALTPPYNLAFYTDLAKIVTSLGARQMVGQQTLDLLIEVRILALSLPM